MPDLDTCVEAMMGENTVLELPEPCMDDLRLFSSIGIKTNILIYVYQQWTELGPGERSQADTSGK